jgi:hypothetical protein
MIGHMPEAIETWARGLAERFPGQQIAVYLEQSKGSWGPDKEPTRTLQLLAEQRRKLVNDKTRLLNRLTSTLKGYFPRVLAWFQSLDTRLVCEFLRRWPTLEAVQEADDRTLLTFFHAYRSKR